MHVRLIISAISIETARSLAGMSAAHAGAWVHGEDEGYLEASVQRDEGEFGGAWRAQTYLEMNLAPGWDLVGKAATLWRDQDLGEDRSATHLGIKRAWVQGGGFVSSGQLSVLFGDSLEGLNCEGEGWEARGLAGWSGKVSGHTVYANLETAALRQGDCRRWKNDLALGVSLGANWRAEAKAFSQQGGGPSSLKAEALLGRNLGDNSFFGISYRREISGEFEEESWIASFSQRF